MTAQPVDLRTLADASARSLPWSKDAETAVLGAVLAHGDLWPHAAAVVTADDFFRDAHRRIYLAMHACVESATAIDFITVKEVLRRSGDLDEVGGPAYLAALADGVPHSTNLAQYGQIVRETARLRGIIAAATRLADDAYHGQQPSGDLIDAGTRALWQLALTSTTDAVSVHRAVGDYLQALDRDLTADLTPTGYHDVDDLLGGGLRHGELTIIAARPSVGKTAFGLTSALTAAAAGKPTVFFSLEMTRNALAGRALASLAKIDAHRIAGRYLAAYDYERMTAAWATLDGLPLVIQDAAGMTLAQLSAWCQRLGQRPEGLACAMVDYLQLLIPETKRQHSRQDDIAVISRGLKRLAKEQHIAVAALSQLSRAPEARSDKRPHLSDLRESGALEQDADVAILLFREEMHKPTDENRGIAEAIVAKNRNGPTGVTKLAFAKEYMRFADLARP